MDSGRYAVRYWRQLADRDQVPGYIAVAALASFATPEALQMSLSGLQVKGGWVLSKLPGGRILGRYVMADGASQYMGAVNDLASFVYERDSDFYYVDDWLGMGYRNAGDFYFGDEKYGDGARFVMSLWAAGKPFSFKSPGVRGQTLLTLSLCTTVLSVRLHCLRLLFFLYISSGVLRKRSLKAGQLFRIYMACTS
ncbi:MAG: hypothetical protein P1U78_03045 [Alcanivoracaceae bacterium]|nr:hypothetical protein [Alcanivoracaceae bacterium]